MSKVISREIDKVKKGLDIVADAVKITIGPRGKNVAIENGLHPIIANDGGRIAKEIVLKDPIENIGANIIKEVIQKTSDEVGGGRTASAIITQALVSGGLKLVEKGFNANLLKKGMYQAATDICAELDKMAKPVKGHLKEVATISTESEELGKVIAETIEKVGLDSVVTVEESQTFGITSEIADGLKFERGYISPYMVTNDRLEAEYTDISVLITDKKLSFFKDLFPIVKNLVDKGQKDLMIIAEDLDGEALNAAVINKLQGRFNVLAIKTPGVGDNKKFTQEDLCALTNATLWSEQNKEVKLGSIKKVKCTKDYTIIQGTGDVKTWITTLKTRRELTDNKWEKDQYDERIAKLSNGIAVIKVGANSESEIKYLKLKVEDGVQEAKRALEEGIVIGGNCAFIHASKGKRKPSTSENELGYNLIIKAIEAPLRQIVLNSNGSPDVVVNELMHKDCPLTAGYNALDNSYTPDMYKAGIIDAVKVSKTILQNAVSSAAMFLSIEATITNQLEETK